MPNLLRYIKTLCALLLLGGVGSVYAGCTVNGTTESGAISLANLKIAIATGTDDVTTCNVSSITNMRSLFLNNTSFNQNISAWNVSNVSIMGEMFYGATAFNQNIGSWNVSSVTDMNSMFATATSFNKNISSWNVSSVTDMSIMFSSANVFNQDISSWNTGSVTTMSHMFNGAAAFNNNGEALDWSNTSSVINMHRMFMGATVFNQDISSWNTSNVTTMNAMFFSAVAFNKPINTSGSSWNTSNVNNMSSMFRSALAFNQNLSDWNVGSVTTMQNMFFNATVFNQSIGNWDMSNVTNTSGMFTVATAYNANPTLSSSSPANGATGIAMDASIILTFNEAVDVESGNITIKKSADDSTVETIAVTDSKITGTGTTQITINPAVTLTSSTEYYLNIDASAFDDASGNSYAGISDATTINFTVIGSNPTLKKDVIGSIEAWSNISSRWAESSIESVFNRIDWLSRRQGSKQTSHQGINISFLDTLIDKIMNNIPTSAFRDIDAVGTSASIINNSNGTLTEVSDNVEQELSDIAINEAAILRESLVGSLNPSFEPVLGNWSVWTEGKIIIGKTDASTTSSKKEIGAQAISLGFDKPIGTNELMGFALSIGKDDADIGTGSTNVNSNNFSLSTYNVLRPSSNTQLESIFGLGRLGFNTVRTDGSDTLTGTRKATQLFFSSALKPIDSINFGNWQVSPFGKVSLANTNLKSFSESGANTALTFNKQDIRDTSVGIGIDINNKIISDDRTIEPYAKIELNKSSSKTSASMNYNSESLIYTSSLNNKHTNLKLKFGLDFKIKSGWDVSVSYKNEQSIGSSKNSKNSNSFSFSAGTRF